ncbi:hypothetical protein [Magnetococcus sp. PR-3]|uniref:hypothetical protein n=1 Tax=Magnetococcus sp. PR-3 TaxID=3120355 RepID=UPI002FCDFD1C
MRKLKSVLLLPLLLLLGWSAHAATVIDSSQLNPWPFDVEQFELVCADKKPFLKAKNQHYPLSQPAEFLGAGSGLPNIASLEQRWWMRLWMVGAHGQGMDYLFQMGRLIKQATAICHGKLIANFDKVPLSEADKVLQSAYESKQAQAKKAGFSGAEDQALAKALGLTTQEAVTKHKDDLYRKSLLEYLTKDETKKRYIVTAAAQKCVKALLPEIGKQTNQNFRWLKEPLLQRFSQFRVIDPQQMIFKLVGGELKGRFVRSDNHVMQAPYGYGCHLDLVSGDVLSTVVKPGVLRAKTP